MRNQLENKAGLIKSINAKHNGVMGLRIGSRTGTGKLVVLPLLSVSRLRCLPLIQGSAAFTLGDKNMSGS